MKQSGNIFWCTPDEMLDYIEVPSHIYQWFKQVRVELERVEQPCT